MTITKKRTWNIIAIFALLLSLITPSFAFANEGVEEERTTGSLTITKLDEDSVEEVTDGTGEETTIEGVGVAGVTYEVFQTHKLVGIQYDEDGTVAHQEWEKLDEPIEIKLDGEALVTDDDGVIHLPDLPLGAYSVQEVSAPEGYFVNSEVFTVEIPMTVNDGKDHLYDVFIYPKNEPNLGEVKLEKVGISNDGEENLLDRIVFQLFVYDKKDDEWIPYTVVNEDDENEEELILETKDGKIEVEDLAVGKYYFKEIGKNFEGLDEDSAEYEKLDSILLNENEIHFEVTKTDDEDGNEITSIVWESVDGFVVVDEEGKAKVKNYERPEIEKDVAENSEADGEESLGIDRNREYVYNVTITAPQDVQDYKVLGVWDKLDDRLTFVHGLDEEDEPLSSLGEDGWVVSSSPESAYEVTEDDIEFGIKDDGTLTWNVKEDSIKKLTPGQEITITFTAKINPDAELTPEEDGIPNQAEIEFDNNKGEENDPGDDPKVPPTPPVIVTPKEGGLKVIKVDKDDKFPLEGAEFKLVHAEDDDALGIRAGDVVDAEGTIITVDGEPVDGLLENLVTDANGEIHIEGLTPGNYQLIETKAPTYTDEDGETHEYRLLTKPVDIEIKGDQTEDLEVTVENSKSGWHLPGTGGIGTVIFTVLGLLLMGGALLASRRRKSDQTT